ncbi:hypothetical protein EYF80_058891 [Liparis tanakae]|uniref:Uncharacterized protein n=1 Tax=Liparis tanakae TaxID=230148 RepID=A0A4Z2EQ53_9TELE|nr:hypothetical protein EYF80_058891 [Liparis tanakae]
MLPRYHWGSVISLTDGVFFNEECNYLNRSAKDTLLLPLPLPLLGVPGRKLLEKRRDRSDVCAGPWIVARSPGPRDIVWRRCGHGSTQNQSVREKR